MPEISVAIADDHALFRQGLTSLLRLQSDISIVAEIDRADAIMETLQQQPCDLLLLDLQMERSTVAEIKALANRLPVIVVTASERAEDAVAALRAGARGLVFKRFALETLMTAIQTVSAGQVWLPPTLQSELVDRLRQPSESALTPREREVVRQVAIGYRNNEIATTLGVSEGTIKTHLNNIYDKLGLRDRVELALYAVRSNIIDVSERRSS